MLISSCDCSVWFFIAIFIDVTNVIFVNVYDNIIVAIFVANLSCLCDWLLLTPVNTIVLYPTIFIFIALKINHQHQHYY